jgi:nitrogen regulatory protein P-II 1
MKARFVEGGLGDFILVLAFLVVVSLYVLLARRTAQSNFNQPVCVEARDGVRRRSEGGGITMWKIETILRPASVEDVAEALKKARVHSFVMSDVSSFDTKNGPVGSYRGAGYTMALPRVKLELLVHDDYVEDAVKSILGAASAPLNGEDWLVVIPLDEVVRIATGRREARQLGR